MEAWLLKVPDENEYFGHYYNPEREFLGAVTSWCEKHPNISHWTQYHTKIGVSMLESDTTRDYYQMLEIYSSIKDEDISPKLIHNEILYNSGSIFAYLLVTEMYGKDLEEKFMNGKYEWPGESSMDLLTNNDLFETFFPKNKIPENVQSQIKEVLTKFHEIGWIHNDIYCPNLLIKDGKVKLIDFEYCSKREVDKL